MAISKLLSNDRPSFTVQLIDKNNGNISIDISRCDHTEALIKASVNANCNIIHTPNGSKEYSEL